MGYNRIYDNRVYMNMFLILNSKKRETGKQLFAFGNAAANSIAGVRKKNMAKYRCIVCRYIYDPAQGDPRQYIHAGTSFNELPDDWQCPECGVRHESFRRL